jgi:hypothetical protein
MFSGNLYAGMFIASNMVEESGEFVAINPDDSEMLNPDDSSAENPS